MCFYLYYILLGCCIKVQVHHTPHVTRREGERHNDKIGCHLNYRLPECLTLFCWVTAVPTFAPWGFRVQFQSTVVVLVACFCLLKSKFTSCSDCCHLLSLSSPRACHHCRQPNAISRLLQRTTYHRHHRRPLRHALNEINPLTSSVAWHATVVSCPL